MRPFLIPLLAIATSAVRAQRIFINQVPAYSHLPPCAEAPLSNVVRNMVSGCGDGGRTTSFDCFCVSSSTKFESVISRAVASKCMPSEPAATAFALAVFDSYCHLSPQAVPALASTQTASPSQNRPPFLSESATERELSTLLLTTTESDATGTLGNAGAAQATLWSSAQGSQVRLPPTPSPRRTQFAPIPSANLASSGPQSLGSQWLAMWLGLCGFWVVVI
ncbi:hypothetical protein QBC40DRAFT_88549 [Triangularia verruculosa]|uniref:Extracellular membrane protein CFEM domain-containing protein n=1 Tax=Triangularia verruculosa TaxID=2587418 RepID=A0AAN7ATT7_9PEZI|nr:hypothetical protein QBC40DRAFT_88549 [Triangularia verruculosa]